MNLRHSLIPFVFLFICVQSLQAVPERAKGISLHMLPKRVAEISGQKWGFSVDYAPYLKPERGRPILQTQEEFLAFVRKQDTSVQENGVWIVVSHPDAYSEPEKKLLSDVKVLCHKEKIALFICRASELPDGWKRFE